MWRDSGRPIRLGPVDGRAAVLILVALYMMKIIIILVCLLGMVGLFVLEKRGYTIPNALRKLNVMVMGKVRPAVSPRRRNRM